MPLLKTDTKFSIISISLLAPNRAPIRISS